MAMEERTGQCVAILVLLVLKFSSPCPEECFVQHEWKFVKRKSCMCPTQRDSSYRISCVSRGITVTADRVCSAENHGLTCLNDVPTGFDQSVTGIMLNDLFNLTTLTKQHIPQLPNLITFGITGSTIQAIEAVAFSSVPTIMSIAIRCSRLLNIDDHTFYSLPSLETIFLDHNLIKAMSPRAAVGLHSLKKMYLHDNQLKAVPFEALSLIRRCTTVARLLFNLEDNQISTVSGTAWRIIVDSRLTIFLKGNPLVCDGRMTWLVCNATTLASSNIVFAGNLRCMSPPELTGYHFKSLHTKSLCLSSEPTSASRSAMASTSPMAESTTLPEKSFGTTGSALTQLARKTTLGTMVSTLGLVLDTNLADGKQPSIDYLYIPLGLTVTVIGLSIGTAVAVIMHKRRVSGRRQNQVLRQHGVIISSQLISNRMYQHSATGDVNDKEEPEETVEDFARHSVTFNTSELISNRLYKCSGSALDNANKDTKTTEETEENSQLTPYLTVPFDAINNTLHIEPYSTVNLEDIRNEETDKDLHLKLTSDGILPSGGNPGAKEKKETEENSARHGPYRQHHGVTIDTSRLISNRLYKPSANNSINKDTVTTKETEQKSELRPYLTVPLDAIDNTLHIEPYSSVNLDDIRDEQMNASGGISLIPEAQQHDEMEQHSFTPLDQIVDP
ncbi:uncharacterized protein LOC144864018 [Branchiostoma floridae x Branchiostoma japonicum]